MKISQLLAAAATAAVLATGSVQAEEPAGETVTIRNDGDNTYYEFRQNGQIVEIKVQPKVGPAYYLVPGEEGAESLERQDTPNMRTPKWVIFRW
ncbi:MAG: DUF2782 domain-containing protein [Alcanivorax sp.]|jgi:type IV secretory pathway VirB9-like protein|nr:MAG: hypothetical protein COA68_02390 [Oceanobacter sp.]|tara:strand:- start:2220 stop:2501 length:282 start_codon:yes stop_codon:yes gene_type:complete